MSQGREPGLTSLAVAGSWRGIVRLYLRAAHRLRVEGLENLPAAPFVIVANHSSHLDALTIAAALPRALGRRAFALAAGDTFFTSLPLATFAAFAINALPVWRKRTTARDIEALRARLHEDGAVLILFPEGTRSRTGAMGRFQPGVGALIAGQPVPVVPCFLDGAFEAWPASRRLPRPGPLHLRIGTPLHFDAVAPGRAGLAEVAGCCEAAVRELGGVQAEG
ncbi:lysophospholipid acyltransferase family protein [Roseomonas elaeocarpi]|uniref:Lysophospholipid acyltransferase family protein n=1 Tax=Roseomonas elaeocarpi TaxID=907779 RepID=A0ABV6JV49_9PROT